MKTFKLISLQIVENGSLLDIPLLDGLIINKEDEKNRWLLEAYLDMNQYEYFEKLYKDQDEITAQVVISKKENDPATFTTSVLSVKKIDGHASVLCQGYLKRTSQYAELLLSNLLDQGLSGEELLTEFRDKLITKPKLTSMKN